ncbi:MAG: hypothetical protein Q9227_004394 [Pyrenula ochraceoflavens]
MRIALDSHGKIKNYIHALQGVIIFFAWALTIAVFTRDGSTDGRTGWFFGMCWLSIPALIYLVMVPMWSRARRFSNVYAFLVIDACMVILWLSAWASVASYVVGGKGKGKNKKASGCDNFKYGSPGKCKLSEATIVLGLVIMLLFGVTAFFSFKAVAYYRRTGTMPSTSGGNDFSKQTQDAFSSNMQHDEFDDEADLDPRQGGRPGMGGIRHSDDDEYGLLHQNGDDDLTHAHPGRPVSYGQPDDPIAMPDVDTSYHGRHSSNPAGLPEYGSGDGPYGR